MASGSIAVGAVAQSKASTSGAVSQATAKSATWNSSGVRGLSIPDYSFSYWRLMIPSLRGRAPDPHRVAPFFGDAPLIIGHRGAAGVAPENTAAAFEVAASLGVPFELDIALCASGELVVIHDDTVDRTTDGSGLVSGMTLGALKALDAGSHFGPEFAGERILTLDEVFGRFGGRVPIDVEVKAPAGADVAGLVAGLTEAVARHDLWQDIFVTTFNPYLLEQLRLRAPRILRGQLYGTFEDSDLPTWQRFALRHRLLNRRAQPDMVAIDHTLASPRYVRWLQGRGYRVLVWTVNEPADLRRVLDAGADGIITDDPAAMRARVAG